MHKLPLTRNHGDLADEARVANPVGLAHAAFG